MLNLARFGHRPQVREIMSIGRAVLHWRLERWAVLCGVGCSLGGCAEAVGLPLDDSYPPAEAPKPPEPEPEQPPSVSNPIVGLEDEPSARSSPVVSQPDPPPVDQAIPLLPVTRSPGAKPILGGTLLVTSDGTRAVMSDPDRNQVFVVDLATDTLLNSVAMQEGDEPGRLVEGSSGHVYVTLRRGNALAEIDVESATQLRRIPTCAGPTGIDFDAQRDWIVVGCHTGRLLALDLDSGEPTWELQGPSDLRDVIVSGEQYIASEFKTATLHVIPAGASNMDAVQQIRPEDREVYTSGRTNYSPNLLRRVVRLQQGELLLQHQYANQSSLFSQYYGSSAGISFGALSSFNTTTGTLTSLVNLTKNQFYDVAVSLDGSRMAALTTDIWISSVREIFRQTVTSTDPAEPQPGRWGESFLDGQGSAVAYDSGGRILVQVREPAALQIVGGARIKLSDRSFFDTGQALFHASTAAGVACASCHPEGGDDGITWDFALLGKRQTMSLQGGLLDTLPLHWEGELGDFLELMQDTYAVRMGGNMPSPAQAQAVGEWIHEQTPLPREPVQNLADVERGRQVFSSAGCDRCHTGETSTDGQNHDVGTGRRYHTPTLRNLVGTAPYMHDGCAPTLRDRFDPACGGDKHDPAEPLTPEELNALIAYLLTL